MFLIDPSFKIEPSVSLIESCHTNVSTHLIQVDCSYGDSTATGFQMIVQLSNSSEVHRLYVNKTTDRQTSESVVVEENGLYQVTVFAIRRTRGIVNSAVEFSERLQVQINGNQNGAPGT